MQLRQNRGARPQITFTSDFDELVQGDLVPGPCVLRYDPLRLVTLGDAATERHHIRAYVRFHPGGVIWEGLMELPSGLPLADLADPTGRGFMLSTSFTIPADCDELEVWFSCTHDDGQTHWDSDHGKNHWLRFGLADLKLTRAEVKPAKKKTDATDTLEFEFTAKSKVDSVEVRWRQTNAPHSPRIVTPLVSSAATATAKGNTWTSPLGGIPVPKGAVI
ncbi:MAG: hypothetical protein RL376_1540, partial [Verrucomicrobiota bacterium]